MPPELEYIKPGGGTVEIEFPHEPSMFHSHHTARPLTAITEGNVVTLSERRSFDMVQVGIERFPDDEPFEEEMEAFFAAAGWGASLSFNLLGSLAKFHIHTTTTMPAPGGSSFVIDRGAPGGPSTDPFPIYNGPNYRYKFSPKSGIIERPHDQDFFHIASRVEQPAGSGIWIIGISPAVKNLYPFPGFSYLVMPEHSFVDCLLVNRKMPVQRHPTNTMSLDLRFRTNWTPVEP